MLVNGFSSCLCRAVAYIGDEVIPLSKDFTADRDVERIYFLVGGHV